MNGESIPSLDSPSTHQLLILRSAFPTSKTHGKFRALPEELDEPLWCLGLKKGRSRKIVAMGKKRKSEPDVAEAQVSSFPQFPGHDAAVGGTSSSPPDRKKKKQSNQQRIGQACDRCRVRPHPHSNSLEIANIRAFRFVNSPAILVSSAHTASKLEFNVPPPIDYPDGHTLVASFSVLSAMPLIKSLTLDCWRLDYDR